eukprot:CAMPEP_0178397214 /NCGR_PEP_ID=MMETSP0689_2-20121128/14129_1 /TAXON_ID=160604 /ORGANISM="Amphidinium massartii, Strain CS-259" /LENGTH=344 /DNA_ID=CAMNT_0020017913 /DNA_START=60 /DNA_END=1091 /DNA_ORIENTATION=-
MPKAMKATLSLVQEETPISHKWRYVIVNEKADEIIDRVCSAPTAAIYRSSLNFASDHLKQEEVLKKKSQDHGSGGRPSVGGTGPQRISGSAYEGNYKVAATCYLCPQDVAAPTNYKSSGSLAANAASSVTSSMASGNGSASTQSWSYRAGNNQATSSKRLGALGVASGMLRRFTSTRTERPPVARIHFQIVAGFTDSVPEAKSEMEAFNMVLIFVVDLCTTPDGHNPPLATLVQEQVKAVERRVVEVKVMKEDCRPACVLLCLTAGADEAELEPVRQVAPKHGFAQEVYIEGFQDDELYQACQKIGKYLMDPNRRSDELEKIQEAAKQAALAKVKQGPPREDAG